MKIFCLFFGLLVCPCLAAETLMVSVGAEGLAGQPDPGRRVCFLALESGLMDVFFDAGKIVFNDEGFRDSEDRYRTVRVAREGGASAVLFVNCVYSPDSPMKWKTGDGDSAGLPERIVLEYVLVQDFATVKKLEITPSPEDAARHPAIERYYFVLGKEAAENILK
ncbi:MAG: hypothetical protein LBT33_03135 [Spirochaetia bacterium]|jgi:hypothetical protein|nr:hypothetical protein [Spirochaetia bacterium]